MTQNNNLSVLPFYNNIELQNHRKSYAFGAIYPLFAPANVLLPFQIMREHNIKQERGNLLTGYDEISGTFITDGTIVSSGTFKILTFDVSDLSLVYMLQIPSGSEVRAVAYDDNGVLLGILKTEITQSYSGYWSLPPQTQTIKVQTTRTTTVGYVYAAQQIISPIVECLLKDLEGNVINITTNILEAGLTIIPFENLGYDIIVYPANFPLPLNMLDGRYYLEIKDDKTIWYSDVFTIVQDVSPYLKIEWWDLENFVFDAGQIVYQNPAFKNRLYFCTELGKPEYQFDEEGESRDGYYFPTKQISEKTYKCTVLAPEYLCDVMRFIRMADYVRITDKYGREYNVDTFLLTPKWQTQGDLASVEIEFETNTVAKKIGRAIGQIITTQRDYNNDFNTDFK